MVGQRKQLKSGRAGGDRSEHMVALSSCPNTRSPLVTLPAEIQSIITSYLVQPRDLNHLCCTCKTLSVVVLPTLYHTIVLKVPLRWSRLPSLEKLLASSCEGLRYTKCLSIMTRQHGQEDNSYCNLDRVSDTDTVDVVENEPEPEDEDEADSDDSEEESEEDQEDDEKFKIYKPKSSASNTLNAFIRVLIGKLPPQQLQTFWWEHACPLNALTLSTVLKHQGASIHTLNFRRYSKNWRSADREELAIGGLTTLSIAGLITGSSWPMRMLARSYKNLRHLQLGNEVDLAEEYAAGGFVDPGGFDRVQLTEKFAEIMKIFGPYNEPYTSIARLESLSLIGLNVHALAKGGIEPGIDFDNLCTLALESCVGLEAAFPLLLGAGAGRREGKSVLRLQAFAIRHENTTVAFLDALKKFLLSLKPLFHLHVLLEGYYEGLHMSQILRLHGKRLRTLIWDERIGPRCDVHEDTALFEDDDENLKLIARFCPTLQALGISLDWEEITVSKERLKSIACSFSQLSQLQTLNIRNLPMTTTFRTWLPNDYMMEGLATMLINIATKNARSDQTLALKTIAIGASTYGNVRLGMNHYTPNIASTFLQLRIYHVNYDCRYRSSLSPKLHLIARGTPADAYGNGENLDIFRLYWLDGILAAPKR